MKLDEILKAKGKTVYTIGPEATLQDVVRTLAEHNVGSLLVYEQADEAEGKPVGIITERDILHACAAGRDPLAEAKVADIMSSDLLTGSPDDAVENVMGLMTSKRIRHLPVLSQGKLVGMVSIGDVVKAQHDRLAMENRFMKDYIQS
ncbi:MAG: CBS domain-containing protein [Pirellulales bacterium]|nr:CBS domain-containing protein [Pirellulales bacterium]